MERCGWEASEFGRWGRGGEGVGGGAVEGGRGGRGGGDRIPFFLHHCEGAPGPVPGEIIAAQKSQAILGSSGTSLPLKIIIMMIIITPLA